MNYIARYNSRKRLYELRLLSNEQSQFPESLRTYFIGAATEPEFFRVLAGLNLELNPEATVDTSNEFCLRPIRNDITVNTIIFKLNRLSNRISEFYPVWWKVSLISFNRATVSKFKLPSGSLPEIYLKSIIAGYELFAVSPDYQTRIKVEPELFDKLSPVLNRTESRYHIFGIPRNSSMSMLFLDCLLLRYSHTHPVRTHVITYIRKDCYRLNPN